MEDRSPIEQLKSFLLDRQLLLMLDSFEHVLPKAPLLTDLLSACPGLKIVVTSRALLHIGGEYEFTVQPLEIPDMQQVAEHESLSQIASVDLFTQRMQAMLPAFQLTDENAHDIATICTRLEGVPLAIELAAEQCKLLPPRILLSSLEHPFDVLVGRRRDTPERQQTSKHSNGIMICSQQMSKRCFERSLFSLEDAPCKLSKPYLQRQVTYQSPCWRVCDRSSI